MSNHRGERAAQRIRLSISVLVLVLLALGSFWVLQTMRSDINNALSETVRSKPDYYVDHFNYVRMAENGQPRYAIRGDAMRHYPKDDSFEIDQPFITRLTEGRASMTLRSERARIEDDNSKIHMYDKVNGDRPATPTSEKMHLTTEYLLLLPDDDIATTDKFAEITMGESIMTGTGMIVNNALQQFELLHHVRGTYKPRVRATKP